jgi:Tol biopolymer transport system component
MIRLARRLAPLPLLLLLAGCGTDEPGATTPPTSLQPALVAAFVSNRPPSQLSGGDIYFYDLRAGTPAYLPPNLNTVYDETQPGLSADGRWLTFFSSRLLTGTQATLFLYDVRTAALKLPESPRVFTQAQNPTLSGNGGRLAFNHQIGGSFLDLTIGLIDAVADTVIPTPRLHEPGAGEFDPALSGDGTLIACTTNRNGTFDVMLYSVPLDSVLALPSINTGTSETGVSISADGRWIAFHSNRPGGSGLFDVYVYDRQTDALRPMPGANTALSELSPALSPDGRYVAYTSENDGAGNIRIYDLSTQKLLVVPGLNDSYHADRFPTLGARP